MQDELISRQAVLAEIFKKPAWHNSDGSYYHADDIRDAVNSVKPQEPTSEQVEEYCRKRCLTLVSNEFMAHIIADSGESIRTVPSAEPTGHWIMRHRKVNTINYRTGEDVLTGEIHTVKELIRYETDEPYCACCGKRAEDISQDYCGYCGARMEVEQND